MPRFSMAIRIHPSVGVFFGALVTLGIELLLVSVFSLPGGIGIGAAVFVAGLLLVIIYSIVDERSRGHLIPEIVENRSSAA